MFRFGLSIALSVLLSLLCWTGSPAFAQASPSPFTVLATSGGNSLFSFSGKRPTNLGVTDGKLLACPDTPNCVSSQSSDLAHKVEPLPYRSSPEQAIANLKTAIAELPRAEVVNEAGNYLYAEFTSALMGFVDDVEFYLEPSESVIHVRSASRLGQSDLGVNRKRVEAIRARLAQLEGV